MSKGEYLDGAKAQDSESGMRTLGEIIELIKSGGEPTHEELYYSVLALEALGTFDSMGMRRMVDKPDSKFITPEYLLDASWRRWKMALGKSPQEWVGWNNDPHNPEYQKGREFSKRLVDKVVKNMNAKKPKGAQNEEQN
jgi:hypothetical protein